MFMFLAMNIVIVGVGVFIFVPGSKIWWCFTNKHKPCLCAGDVQAAARLSTGTEGPDPRLPVQGEAHLIRSYKRISRTLEMTILTWCSDRCWKAWLFHQTLQVHLISDAQKMRSSNWPKLHCTFNVTYCNSSPFVSRYAVSHGPTNGLLIRRYFNGPFPYCQSL